MGTFRQSP